MNLVGETTAAPTTEERESINISPEAKKALRDLLMRPEMQGVGYSEFILRAVDAAGRQLERRAKYVASRRRMVRDCVERELTDEEVDALLAKLDAAAPTTHEG